MFSLILLAGGVSSRFGGGDKLKSLLGWIPVFLHSLARFYRVKDITEIIIVANESSIGDYELLQKDFPKIKHVVKWWAERSDSVRNWMDYVSNDYVLIHNWCNCLVTEKEIDSVMQCTVEYWASCPWKKVVNTVKKVWMDNLVITTVDRSDLYEVQTPQWVNAKQFKLLLRKHVSWTFTDDVSYFEREWLPVKIVEASDQNFKITTTNDLVMANAMHKQDLLCWLGHDSHRFLDCADEYKPLIIWWVEITKELSFEANSDWDVLIHSLCNALWTSIGGWSLSLYADQMCSIWEKSSEAYLAYILNKVNETWYIIWNISISLEWKRPKLEKFIPLIKEQLAKLLGISTYQIWIACTSWEELSDFWKGKWLQCFTMLTLKKS